MFMSGQIQCTRANFFKPNTTLLSNEGRIKISALYAQKHFSKKGLKNPHTELSLPLRHTNSRSRSCTYLDGQPYWFQMISAWG